MHVRVQVCSYAHVSVHMAVCVLYVCSCVYTCICVCNNTDVPHSIHVGEQTENDLCAKVSVTFCL